MIKKIILAAAFAGPLFCIAQQKSMPSAKPRIAVVPAVGYAWRLAKSPENLTQDTKSYVKGLKNGLDISIGTYYLLSGNGAVGLKYSGYFTSSEGRITVQNTTGQSVTGAVSTTDNINFFGAAYMFSNFKSDTRHKFFYDIALGLITYTTKTGNVKGTGSNIGSDINFAYQYAITERFFIGPKIGLTAGTLTEMSFNGVSYDFAEDQREGLTRLSASAAATFRF